jgi:hypothetical protein
MDEIKTGTPGDGTKTHVEAAPATVEEAPPSIKLPPTLEEVPPATEPKEPQPPKLPHQKVWAWIRRDTTSTDWLIVLLTAVIAGTSYLQWREIHHGSSDTHDLAVAAKAQADKMKDVSDAADKIRQAADNMVTQDQRIADNAQNSLNASNRQGRAALDASIESSHLDQRAWLNVSGFKLSEEPTLDQGATVLLSVFNSGKTPALEMTNESILLSSNIEPPPTAFSFELNPVSRSIVPPGTAGTFFKTNPLTLKTLSQASAYGSGLSKIYVEAIIHYKDTFGHSHWTRVCAWHASGAPLDTFLFCEHGNEMDQSN